MKKSYIKPFIGIQVIETCDLMVGSGPTPISQSTVLVGDMGATQTLEQGILKGGGDASEDVNPTSKNHSLWDDDDWD